MTTTAESAATVKSSKHTGEGESSEPHFPNQLQMHQSI